MNQWLAVNYMAVLTAIIALFGVHFCFNLLVIHRTNWVRRVTVGMNPRLATYLFGPEVGWRVLSPNTNPIKDVVVGGIFGSLSLVSGHWLAFPLLNWLRVALARSPYGIQWSVKQFLAGFQSQKVSFAAKLNGHLFAPGLMIPQEWGAIAGSYFQKAKETPEAVWDTLKGIYRAFPESLEEAEKTQWSVTEGDYVYRGHRVVVLPLLNAAAIPLGSLAKDIVGLVNRVHPTGVNMSALDKGNVLVIDPLVWAAFVNKQRWAVAIVDHEVGHQESIGSTKLGKLTYYARFVAKPNSKLFWFAILLQEAHASGLALLQDEQIDKIKATTLGLAFSTYIKAAIDAVKKGV